MTLYPVIPITKDRFGWLKEVGLDPSLVIREGRYPTPKEIQTVLESLGGLTLRYFTGATRTWQVTVSGSGESGLWTEVVVTDFSGDMNAPHQFHFESGAEEIIIRILQELSKICGAFVVLTESGEKPILVTSE